MGTICLIASLPLYFPAIGFKETVCNSENPPYQIGPKENNKSNTTLPCASSEYQAITIYYSVFSAIQGFGWAAIKTSHLSLIPVLARNKSSKITLSSIRYVADIMSNLLSKTNHTNKLSCA